MKFSILDREVSYILVLFRLLTRYPIADVPLGKSTLTLGYSHRTPYRNITSSIIFLRKSIKLGLEQAHHSHVIVAGIIGRSDSSCKDKSYSHSRTNCYNCLQEKYSIPTTSFRCSYQDFTLSLPRRSRNLGFYIFRSIFLQCAPNLCILCCTSAISFLLSALKFLRVWAAVIELEERSLASIGLTPLSSPIWLLLCRSLRSREVKIRSCAQKTQILVQVSLHTNPAYKSTLVS